jgi:hypothetical protein
MYHVLCILTHHNDCTRAKLYFDKLDELRTDIYKRRHLYDYIFAVNWFIKFKTNASLVDESRLPNFMNSGSL